MPGVPGQHGGTAVTVEKGPQNVGQALQQARQERTDAGEGHESRVIARQVADALIGIRWALVGIMEQVAKR
jgi:hypothetical protein